jgi:heme exporter protein D
LLLRTDRTNQAFAATSRSTRARTGLGGTPRHASRPRMTSTSGYMAAAGATAAALFFALWWMLHTSGDEAPWVPAGLAASVVMLVALAAREVVVRRAYTRYILEQDRRGLPSVETRGKRSSSNSNRSSSRSLSAYANALRELQKQSGEADAAGALPNLHLEAYHSCKEYLASTEEALRTKGINMQSLAALRAGQERVRSLQKHHLLTWASGSARALTFEAQRRVTVSDKIEMAMRALDVIDSALKIYPDETELNNSASAIREYIASVKVAHWVELAERAAFKGQYRRAIDRYRDALFYLSRENMEEATRAETAERISREIEMLRARLKMRETAKADSASSRKQGQDETHSD